MFPNIRDVNITDDAHKQNYLHITLFGVWGIYANDKMLYLSMVPYHDNKYDNIWTIFISLFKDIITEINKSRACITADGENYYTNDLKTTMYKLSHFYVHSMRRNTFMCLIEIYI